MSKVGVGLLLTAALVLTPMWAAAEFKVGVVDGMDVVSKSAAGKRVQDSIKRKSEELGKPFAQRRQELGQAGGGFPEAGIRDERRCPQDQGGRAGKRRCRNFKSRRRRRKATAAIPGKSGAVIPETGRRRQNRGPAGELDMVLDKRNAGLLYMDPKMDITDKVRSSFGK